MEFYKIILIYLLVINFIGFCAMFLDKRKAQKGKWRTSEAQLHTLEFLGGWIGAFLAQKIFRHKNKKKSYQAMFWLMLVFQFSVIYYILTFLKIIR